MQTWRRVALLGLFGLAAGSLVRADPLPGHALIARCAQEAPPEARGIDRLEAACPGIGPAVDGLGLAPLLPGDWRTRVSPRALADLSSLGERYAGSPHSTLPSASRLQAIALTLKGLSAPPSLWDRFVAWLRHWFEPASGEAPEWLRWVGDWVARLRLQEVLPFAAMGLILIAAGTIVVIELRAAGILGPRRRRVSRGPDWSSGDLPASERVGSLAELDSAPTRLRPVLLLRLLVEALVRSRRLARDRDLTCRELIARASFDEDSQREEFKRVALLAERVLYGSQDEPATISDEVLRGGRSLYAELLAAPAVRRPAAA